MSYVATDAAAYERSMGRWSRRLAEPFLDAIALPPGANVLDAGCGTGALSDALRMRDATARVIGLDPGLAYLRGRTDVVAGDIAAPPFAPGSFDAACALLVLGFVPDPVAALRGMAEAVRPGGIVAAAMWDFRGGFPFLNLFADTAAALLPEGAAWRARHWGEQIGQPGRLAAAFSAAGLRHIKEADIAIRQDFTGFEDWYAPWLTGQGIVGAFLMSLRATDRAMLEAALRAAWGDGPCSFAATARLAMGMAA